MNHPTKRITILFLLLILPLVSCNHPNPALPLSLAPTSTITQIATSMPSPSPTSITPEVRALVKHSIEFYRDGKTYEVVFGYDVGDAFWKATQQPALPKKYDEVGQGYPRLEGYGDFDQDGEIEFYVTVTHCDGNCLQELRLYKYDLGQDQYKVVDKLSAEKFHLDNYKDLNQDGNPELIVNGLGYCLYGEAGNHLFTAVTVMRYERGKLRDVTKEFPTVIAENAEYYLSYSKTDGDYLKNGELLLASYLYDMYRLGKPDEARPNFDQVCNEVVKPRREKEGENFDCLAFRTEVEADIQKYEQSKSQK